MRVLLVEDDKSLGRLIKQGLEEENFIVDWVSDGILAEEYAFSRNYLAIVLDLMLPKRDGFNVLENLRKRGVKIPVLILTARGALEDKVMGLNLGADDYLPKPFALPELVARLRALIRRAHNLSENRVSFGDVVVDLSAKRVHKNGEEVYLTANEFKLLSLLILNANMILSKMQLMEQIYSWESSPESNVLEVLISKLRKKLDPEGKYIKTAKGLGYMLKQ